MKDFLEINRLKIIEFDSLVETMMLMANKVPSSHKDLINYWVVCLMKPYCLDEDSLLDYSINFYKVKKNPKSNLKKILWQN